ncbi:MAG TPA: GIY-YIG nuclease family protein [Dissulfurispiraceae bacterium]|nr:GIY-YIG nuclease family protein [Dissulfurispiraceae bacterium]
MSCWCVYILNCRGGFLYTGSTNNLQKRLQEHVRGTGSRFVRSRLPFAVLKTIACASQSQALSLESHLKMLRKNRKVQMIELNLDAAGYLTILNKEKEGHAAKK